MPFRNGRAARQAFRDGPGSGYPGLTLKLHGPVQNRHIRGNMRRGDQNERSRFTPTLRAAATIDAQVSSGSGTPV